MDGKRFVSLSYLTVLVWNSIWEIDLKFFERSSPWKRIKLYLVGDSGAGKSSVLRWLKGDKFEEEHVSTDSVEISTIELKEWKVSQTTHLEFLTVSLLSPSKFEPQNKPSESGKFYDISSVNLIR